MALDWTRKPSFNRHKDNGFFVVDYPDQPGSYFDEAGNPVSDKLAEEAGHNIKLARVERDKRRAIEQAKVDAEAEASVKIAAIRAAASPEMAREKSLGAEAGADGLYRLVDTHGNVLKQDMPFDEALAAIAIAHGFEGLAQPTVDAEIRQNGSPSGKFRVVAGDKVLGEKLGRGEAEALALKHVGG
jgi:hypothetical protein